MSTETSHPRKVRILDPRVSQQVAAGEVVDRPASVIKELIENALDAGASNIEVEITGGGSERIAVIDDGRGMDREDAQNAVLAHATSKIASVEDLESVFTLGFRGEALPSIASVASFELASSTGEGAATKVSVEGGEEAKVSAVSRPRGTTVTVERLFYNVPARREFLKSKKVERAAITETVTHLALAHPEVAFKLTDDNREQLSLPASGDLLERLAGIYGLKQAGAFRRVEHESFPYRVTGYAALPSVAYTNRYSCQTVVVNGRWVKASSVTKAVDEAYRGTLPTGRYPPVVLYIEVDRRKVDVNVHPTKQVVRFSDDAGVRRAVGDSIGLAIGSIGPGSGSGTSGGPGVEQVETGRPASGGAGGSAVGGGGSSAASTSRGADSQGSQSSRNRSQGRLTGKEDRQERARRSGKQERENAERLPEFQRRAADASKPLRDDVQDEESGRPAQGESEQAEGATGGASPASIPAEPVPEDLPERGALPELANSRVIGQFGLGYILVEEPGSLWVVDQHVAHERVLLDRLQAGEEDVSVQQLLTPEVVEVSDTEAAEGRDLLEELSVYGFEAEPFGPRSFRITAVISTLADRDVGEAFKDALSVARGTSQGPHREQKILATVVACKSAVKLGDRLSQAEMESLVEQWLNESERPATRPHGRCICYRIDAKEVAKKLDRH